MLDPIGVDPETGQGLASKVFDTGLKALGCRLTMLMLHSFPNACLPFAAQSARACSP
ncbi:hypothetical protein GCM10007874_50240 [Labrys miyagiensis]|uniref:Uncharacterized protein n=1 Tax=Labrys miyagiensis TaxID=346912 RepID=A0ABQ6CNP9_9HYPH|nr:hypothetical protein GCM10007874_50240 [Labrys miyagiensis]